MSQAFPADTASAASGLPREKFRGGTAAVREASGQRRKEKENRKKAALPEACTGGAVFFACDGGDESQERRERKDYWEYFLLACWLSVVFINYS